MVSRAAMDPFGGALRAFFEGDRSATLIIRRDDGLETVAPVAYFFREVDSFSGIETAALDSCRGEVLDIGAGSGLHSLVLLSRGFRVTPIDISPAAVHVMHGRGLQNAVVADVWTYGGGPFDTLLLLGNGLGLVAGADGIPAFLAHAAGLLKPGGRLLAESLDVTRTDDPAHLAYHERNRQAGLPIGMTTIQIEFGGVAGPYFGWPHFDGATLGAEAAGSGWKTEILAEQTGGGYLAGLTR